MDSQSKPRLVVLFASQTGNAADVADRIRREAERGGCPNVNVLSMDSFNASVLNRERLVVFVVSTTGQGESPDTMKLFWKFLLQRNLSHSWLVGLRFAVFGLGDSGYQKYNFTAKKLNKRMIDLGAVPIIERGLGDDQHPSGYEGTLDPWLLSFWSKLNNTNSAFLPRISEIFDPNKRILDHPKYQILYHSSCELHSDLASTSDFQAYEMCFKTARSMALGSPLCGAHSKHHCFLRMVTNTRLTKNDPERDVRHLEFEFPNSRYNYSLGDVLEILPNQNPTLVDAFIKRCKLDPNCFITIQFNKSHSESQINGSTETKPIKLKNFVSLTMDVASASPRRYFFEIMSFFTSVEHEKERLLYFASSEGRDDLYQYNQKERRTVLEILEDFPSVQMPFEWLVQLVPPLKTRKYSISSSPLCHPHQVHLTVSVVSWTTPYKRKRIGLCSSWLSSLDPININEIYIPTWFHIGSLPSPSPSIPLILVGPGTGCAPFRAFIEDRAISSENGTTAPIAFFFGCRNEKIDFLYEKFWLFHSRKEGVLSKERGGGFFVAFSRDQPRKIYVQHKMKETSELIWGLLSSGAEIYLAGSSTKMPADVISTFEDIIAEESDVSVEVASRWLKMLERAGKFHVETWS